MSLHLDECPNHWRNFGQGSAVVDPNCGCAELPLRERVKLLLRRAESKDTLDQTEARLESMSLFPELARAWLRRK